MVTVFLAAVDASLRAAFEASPQLDERLARLAAEARSAWPGLHVPDEELFRYLGARVPSPAALDALPAADLYLACACARGDAAAAAAFEAPFAAVVAALRGLGFAPQIIDEAAQVVRVLLLTRDGARPPGISGYSGRGDLAGWLRVVLTRELVRHRRAADRQPLVESGQLRQAAAEVDDPELEYLKRVYRDEFRQAFHAAFDALSSRDRRLLHYQLIEQLNIEEMGALHGVHRATVARWLATTRQTLVDRTRQEMIARLRISGPELNSILRLIESQLDVSLQRILKEPPG